MLYLEEKYNTERINYKCPKSTLILSKNISLKKNNLENELNLNDNDNNYVINSVKLQNYYQNTFKNFSSDYFCLIPSKYVTLGIPPLNKTVSQISEMVSGISFSSQISCRILMKPFWILNTLSSV